MKQYCKIVVLNRHVQLVCVKGLKSFNTSLLYYTCIGYVYKVIQFTPVVIEECLESFWYAVNSDLVTRAQMCDRNTPVKTLLNVKTSTCPLPPCLSHTHVGVQFIYRLGTLHESPTSVSIGTASTHAGLWWVSRLSVPMWGVCLVMFRFTVKDHLYTDAFVQNDLQRIQSMQFYQYLCFLVIKPTLHS